MTKGHLPFFGASFGSRRGLIDQHGTRPRTLKDALQPFEPRAQGHIFGPFGRHTLTVGPSVDVASSNAQGFRDRQEVCIKQRDGHHHETPSFPDFGSIENGAA